MYLLWRVECIGVDGFDNIDKLDFRSESVTVIDYWIAVISVPNIDWRKQDLLLEQKAQQHWTTPKQIC